jgi:hypothetical protein
MAAAAILEVQVNATKWAIIANFTSLHFTLFIGV